MSIGTRIKQARKAAGMTQEDLAVRTGMKQSTISDLEIGKSRGTTNLALAASVLGVNALWLETGKGSAKAQRTERTHNVDGLEGVSPPPPWMDGEAFKVLSLFYALDHEGRQGVIGYLEGLVSTGMNNRAANEG